MSETEDHPETGQAFTSAEGAERALAAGFLRERGPFASVAAARQRPFLASALPRNERPGTSPRPSSSPSTLRVTRPKPRWCQGGVRNARREHKAAP